MAGPAASLLGIALVAALIFASGSSGATLAKTPEQIKADAFKQGSLDGANDCANKLPKKVDPTVAAKSGNATSYADGYNEGWAKACGGAVTPLSCITADAGMTLSAAQLAYVKLKYGIADVIGVCGASTIAATKSFQTGNALPITGIIDKATAQKLAAKASAGDSTYSETFADPNGVAWTITNPAPFFYMGKPNTIPASSYNGKVVTGPNTTNVKDAIRTFAEGAAGELPPMTTGRNARNGRPHTPLARAIGANPMSGRPLGGGQFPSYSYYM